MLVSPPRLARLAAFAALLTLVATPLGAQTPGSLDPVFGGGDGIYAFEPNGTATHANVLDAVAGPDDKFFEAGSVLAGDYNTFACRIISSANEIFCLTLPFDLGGTDNDSGNAVALGT